MIEAGATRATPTEPTPPTRSLGFGGSVFCGLGLGAVGAFSFPPHALPLLLPIALTGLFALLQDRTPRQAAYIGQAFGTVLAAIALRWLGGMFGAAAVSLWALIGAFTAVTCGLAVWLRSRLPRVPFPLLLAVAWAGIEYFRSEPMALNFAWLGVGYSLVDSAMACRLASVLGSYGVSFVVIGWCAYAAIGRRPLLVALRLVPLLLLLFLPFPTSSMAPDPATAFQVRLVQAASEDDESLFRLSQLPANASTRLIVWPEDSYISDPRPKTALTAPGDKTPNAHKTPQQLQLLTKTRLWKRLRALPLENRCYFLLSARDELDPKDDARFCKTAFLLDSQGRVVGQHVKNHTVHFIKDGVAGTDAHVFPTPFGKLGVGICFDMDYPDVARRLVNNGAESLIVPADNPLEWGAVQHAQHKQLFQMRAAECGRWLATTDVAGNTFLVAPTGHIVQSVRTTDPTALDVLVGRTQGRTLFVRGGWRFGQLCLTLLILYFLWAACPARFRGRGFTASKD